ncbi:MAG: ribokinase [Robiginitomaculum sp.]|nr:ribokinase [Robiginitomaculum sp.]MDQ7077906.1 ribokinase [Robiginitomaculum sp.]
MKHPKVTVIGSINGDISFAVDQFPRPNETILATGSALCMGGKGLNQAIAAARAGATTTMIGCVGTDSIGDRALGYAKDNGLDLTGIKRVSHTSTGTAGILVNTDGENMIVVSPGANACLTADDLHRHKGLITGAEIVITQLEVPPGTVRAALDMATKAGVRTVFNPAPATPEAADLIAYADIITPNESETQTITGIYPHDEASASEAAKALCARGAKDVLITMGEAGYYVFSQGEGEYVKAFAVKAIDPTGAGDVFNGVLAKVLASHASLGEAARHASAAAALSVQCPGAEGAAPDWLQIQDFLTQNAPV